MLMFLWYTDTNLHNTVTHHTIISLPLHFIEEKWYFLSVWSWNWIPLLANTAILYRNGFPPVLQHIRYQKIAGIGLYSKGLKPGHVPLCTSHNIWSDFPTLLIWVIKIKKLMILCAHSTLRSSEQSTKTDQAARTYERFVYSIVKIRRMWLSNSMADISFEKFMRCTKVCGLCLTVLFGHWLAGQANSSHVVINKQTNKMCTYQQVLRLYISVHNIHLVQII